METRGLFRKLREIDEEYGKKTKVSEQRDPDVVRGAVRVAVDDILDNLSEVTNSIRRGFELLSDEVQDTRSNMKSDISQIRSDLKSTVIRDLEDMINIALSDNELDDQELESLKGQIRLLINEVKERFADIRAIIRKGQDEIRASSNLFKNTITSELNEVRRDMFNTELRDLQDVVNDF